MKIRFTATRIVANRHKGTPQETRYEAGKTYDLPDSVAVHWLNRQVAEVVSDDEPAQVSQDAPVAKGSDDDMLLAILDGSVTEVVYRLAGLPEDDLRQLRELDDRKGVQSAIDERLNVLEIKAASDSE
jgi:hypothetical protein